jgi:hypothetical protein
MRSKSLSLAFGAAVVVSAMGVSVASAQITIPGSARSGPLLDFPGDGLTAKLWYASVRTIADAQAVINSRFSDTAFLSTQGVDYPQGPLDFLPNNVSTLADFLGTDAVFLPFDPTTRGIGANIYEFTGYFAANAGESLRLGVGSDDGFRLTIGGVDVGSADDRGFAFTFADVSFEESGLYPITLVYYANDFTDSGVLFAQETASGIVPVSVDRLYIVPAPGAMMVLGASGLLCTLGGRRRRVG